MCVVYCPPCPSPNMIGVHSYVSGLCSLSTTPLLVGLAGMDLPNRLIKSAVGVLQGEFPHMSIFYTLSPIPGFKKWLTRVLNSHEGPGGCVCGCGLEYCICTVRGGNDHGCEHTQAVLLVNVPSLM